MRKIHDIVLFSAPPPPPVWCVTGMGCLLFSLRLCICVCGDRPHPQACLAVPEIQGLLADARAGDGVCPFCYDNALLPTPVEFEPPNEVMKKAKELMAHATSFGVVLQGLHHANGGDEEDHSRPPSAGVAGHSEPKALFGSVDPATVRPVDERLVLTGKLGGGREPWWHTETSILTRFVHRAVVLSLLL